MTLPADEMILREIISDSQRPHPRDDRELRARRAREALERLLAEAARHPMEANTSMARMSPWQEEWTLHRLRKIYRRNARDMRRRHPTDADWEIRNDIAAMVARIVRTPGWEGRA